MDIRYLTRNHRREYAGSSLILADLYYSDTFEFYRTAVVANVGHAGDAYVAKYCANLDNLSMQREYRLRLKAATVPMHCVVQDTDGAWITSTPDPDDSILFISENMADVERELALAIQRSEG